MRIITDTDGQPIEDDQRLVLDDQGIEVVDGAGEALMGAPSAGPRPTGALVHRGLRTRPPLAVADFTCSGPGREGSSRHAVDQLGSDHISNQLGGR